MRRNLFLYLTLACFVGLIAIFIVDGYMGIYDTLYVTAGEREQRVEADFWLRSAKWDNDAWNTQANRGDKVFFRYEVDNRQFSPYDAEVNVSVWRSQQKLRDLLSQSTSIDPFDKGELEWEVDTTKFKLPEEAGPEQSFEFSVLIKRGEIERRIIVHVNPLTYPPKAVPVPPR